MRYLDRNGRDALQTADAEYAVAIALLGDAAERFPDTACSSIEHDSDRVREVQVENRQAWADFASTLSIEVLESVQPHIERSEEAAVQALNYLEDHDLRETAHSAIHRAGAMRSGLFGCPVHFRDDDFRTECPTAIAHIRFGASAGLVSDFECSICGRLVEDCDHIMGAVYAKTAGRTGSGECVLCGAVECEHETGKAYETRAYANAKNAVAHEISWVARPRYPLARIREKSVNVGAAGDDPRVQALALSGDLNCDVCIGPCRGFSDMSDWGMDKVL